MSDESPANKRPRSFDVAGNDIIGGIVITDLLDFVFLHCFAFIGKENFRFIAGVNRRFRAEYSIDGEEETGFESKTTWKSAASSVPCPQLCLEDFCEEAERLKQGALEKNSLEASKMGCIEVLDWARDSGVGFTPLLFANAALSGHIRVLDWAKENSLEWYSKTLLENVPTTGQICVFEWVEAQGRDVRVRRYEWDALQEESILTDQLIAQLAAANNQVRLLSWLKERNMLIGNEIEVWRWATKKGCIQSLNWIQVTTSL